MKNVTSRQLKMSVMVSVLLLLLAGVAQAFPKAGQMPATQPGAPPVELAGKVIETMNAGGYTYVHLEKGQQKIWAAVPAMEVKVGDELNLQSGKEMGPFTSKSLDRTFDKIVFSSGPVSPAGQPPQPAAAATMPEGHPDISSAANQAKMADAAGSPPPVDLIKSSGTVVETFNSGGYTYICLEKDGQKSWAAVPPVEVKVGADVSVRPGMEMPQFTSKTLNRTFENIIFSPGIQIN
ncbi:MAG: hypothetical protein RQ754_01270 [Desulfuromonadales bacterium]|nr:hypothetical protein [Desulfuromonadales bacterium]